MIIKMMTIIMMLITKWSLFNWDTGSDVKDDKKNGLVKCGGAVP